jgi:hypothetical protein
VRPTAVTGVAGASAARLRLAEQSPHDPPAELWQAFALLDASGSDAGEDVSDRFVRFPGLSWKENEAPPQHAGISVSTGHQDKFNFALLSYFFQIHLPALKAYRWGRKLQAPF